MNKKKLYTVILEFGGGTYISQVSGESPAAALPNWMSQLQDQELAKWAITRNELISIIESDRPVPLGGCVGVWCLTGSVKNGLALINVVATDGSS
ncbi:MAG: hypothetical protein LAO03_10050 [Acidobacteriia bacterium]|nr:hypothetical protein [Terriglobia bacterium]MBZ5720711.1 hypothetical protein [Terriglobia bacterium]